MMTQSSLISTTMLSSKLMDMPQKALCRASQNNDDSFMNILNDRMQSTNGLQASKTQQPERFKPLTAVNENRPVSKEKVEAPKENVKEAPASQAKPEKTTEAANAKAEKAESPKSESETNETDSKKAAVNILESILSLLQQLAGSPETSDAASNSTQNATDSQQATTVDASAQQTPNAADLLKALLEGNTDKLKDLIGKLDGNNESPEFKNLLDNLQNLVKKLETGEGQDVLKSMLNLKVVVEGQDVNQQDLMLKLKAQCQDTIDKLKVQISELKGTAQQGKNEESEISQPLIPEVNEADQSLNAKTSTGDKNEIKPEIKLAAKDKPEQSAEIKAETPKTDLPKPLENNPTDLSKDMNIQQNQKPLENPSQIKTEKAPAPLSEKPLSQTVTNQVMMKVKLMSGENKQEMEMHLKPESLGKLSLRIIHERGEVLAKITAENEQVKGILESNMQLLKDSLEKSGLSVQSLSVSVGNNQQKNQTSQQGQNSNLRSGTANQAGKVTGLSETLANRARTLNPYEENSQIDLTA